jgi:hypothetical protein
MLECRLRLARVQLVLRLLSMTAAGSALAARSSLAGGASQTGSTPAAGSSIAAGSRAAGSALLPNPRLQLAWMRPVPSWPSDPHCSWSDGSWPYACCPADARAAGNRQAELPTPVEPSWRRISPPWRSQPPSLLTSRLCKQRRRCQRQSRPSWKCSK